MYSCTEGGSTHGIEHCYTSTDLDTLIETGKNIAKDWLGYNGKPYSEWRKPSLDDKTGLPYWQFCDNYMYIVKTNVIGKLSNHNVIRLLSLLQFVLNDLKKETAWCEANYPNCQARPTSYGSGTIDRLIIQCYDLIKELET